MTYNKVLKKVQKVRQKNVEKYEFSEFVKKSCFYKNSFKINKSAKGKSILVVTIFIENVRYYNLVT